jgi:DNA-directed RNA polymerase specialized sigma24 family protein
VSDSRPPRLRSLPPEVVAEAGDPDPGLPDAELLERLEEALAQLPHDERAAVVTSFGYDEGTPGVVAELGVVPGYAESLTAQGLRRLRQALADVHLDDRQVYGALHRARSRRGAE